MIVCENCKLSRSVRTSVNTKMNRGTEKSSSTGVYSGNSDCLVSPKNLVTSITQSPSLCGVPQKTSKTLMSLDKNWSNFFLKEQR